MSGVAWSRPNPAVHAAMPLLLARPRPLAHSGLASLCLCQFTRKHAIGPASKSHVRRLLATSTTAIHVSTKSSARFQSLKEQVRASLVELSNLQCANRNRIQLALRCLEQDNAPTRVAVLVASTELLCSHRESMGAPTRFLRLLLADPLAPPQGWEEELVDWCGIKGAQGLLLRYSPTTIPLITFPNSPLASLSFPSPFLRLHNLEILLTSLPPTNPSEEDIYVPALVAPVPAPGYDLKPGPHRLTGMVMRYPVHKSIIFSGGLGELFTTAGLVSRLGVTGEGVDNVRSVAWLPGMNKEADKANRSGGLQFFDLEAAESAFDHFRATPSNTDAFQRESLASGLAELQNWIKRGTEARPHTLPGVTRSLVSSIMRSIVPSLTHPPVPTSPAIAGLTPQPFNATGLGRSEIRPAETDTIESLTDAMQAFSTTSHQELKSSLDNAFASHLWNGRLAWYRLLFNLDDVGYLASSTLSGRILPNTEHEGWALTGRMWGAGFRGFSESQSASRADHGPPVEAKIRPTASEEEIARVIAAADAFSHVPSMPSIFSYPYKPIFPSFFPNAWTTVATTLIPPLQSAATTHVLASASLFFTSLFTTLLLHFSQVPLYTSLTSTAVGSILSMGYLQRNWEREKATFEHEVREVARQAVVNAERWGWGVLQNGGERMVMVPSENEPSRRVLDIEGFSGSKIVRAKEAVKLALTELDGIDGRGE